MAIEPNNSTAHANLAVGYSVNTNYQQAIQHIKVALKLAPNNVVDKKIAAETYLRAGQPGRAVQYYQSACDICQSPDIMAPLAWLLATNPKVRNPEETLRLARQTLAINPSAANLDLFATALSAGGKFEQAVQIESRALSREDSLPVYREHLSMFQNHKMITVE